jgi:hypothetical protein
MNWSGWLSSRKVCETPWPLMLIALTVFNSDFRRRFLTLLSYNFREFGSVTALSVIEAANSGAKSTEKDHSKRGQLFFCLILEFEA